MIHDIIADIKSAKNGNAYIASLALALTLPDICSKIEFQKDKYGRGDYISWFDNWVFPFYKQPDSQNKIINKGIEATAFNGRACYALRCALLHSGNIELILKSGEKEEIVFDSFELFICENGSLLGDHAICSVSDSSASNIHVELNMSKLIDTIIQGTMKFIEANNEKIELYYSEENSRHLFGGVKIEILEATSPLLNS